MEPSNDHLDYGELGDLQDGYSGCTTSSLWQDNCQSYRNSVNDRTEFDKKFDKLYDRHSNATNYNPINLYLSYYSNNHSLLHGGRGKKQGGSRENYVDPSCGTQCSPCSNSQDCCAQEGAPTGSPGACNWPCCVTNVDGLPKALVMILILTRRVVLE